MQVLRLVNRLLPWQFRSRNNFVKAHANHFFRMVLRTPPVGCDKSAEVELHSLVCKRDTNMLILAAKSFLTYAPGTSLVIHEDGTLSDDDCTLLQCHLPGSRIIRRCDADRELASILPDEIMKHRRDGVFLMKLFDFNHFSHGRKLISLDSDIVFLQRPTTVLEWISGSDERGAFYNEDPTETFRAATNPCNRQLPPRFNAGFMGFDGPLELDEIVQAMRSMDYWREDQTIYSWLLATRNIQSLPRMEYFVFDGVAIPPQACMVHFINPVRFTNNTYIDAAREVCQRLCREKLLL